MAHAEPVAEPPPPTDLVEAGVSAEEPPAHPMEAGMPADDTLLADAGAPEAETVMDFSSHDDGDETGGETRTDPLSDVHSPEAEGSPVAAAPARARRGHRGADPDARKKLLWVALAVLILVVLVVLGALG
jgi:hypothetical protein